MFQTSASRFRKFMSIFHASVPHVRFMSTDVTAQSLLVNVLGMNEDLAKKFIAINRIDTLDPNKLQDTVQFIKNQKYKLKDVIKYPRIFQQIGRKTWEHYYNYFKDCGCIDVPITNIINFRKIRYSTIAELKDQGIIPPDTVVVHNLVKQLDCPLSEEDVSDLRNDNLTLSYVHRVVTHRYLMTRLGANYEDLEKISRIHSYIYNKSLKTFCENINLALDIGFSPKKILKNAYILQTNPERTHEVLSKLPTFLNIDMKRNMRNNPKWIGLSMNQINTMYTLLKKHKISDETITKAMNIFTLSPATVEERLVDIKSTPETRVLMNDPATLKLIIHYHRAKSRLNFLHKVRLKCTSLVVIGFHERLFDNYLKEGKDVNKRHEAHHFLCALLNCTKNDVDLNLKKHPYYLYVPFVEIENTFKFLKRNHFTNEHIIRAISILLYPIEKIEDALETIRTDHYLTTRKPRVSKSKILNLALYYLEKDHHFTGNGIWRVNEDYVQTLQ